MGWCGLDWSGSQIGTSGTETSGSTKCRDCRVATHLVGSRVVLSSIELVIYAHNERSQKVRLEQQSEEWPPVPTEMEETSHFVLPKPRLAGRVATTLLTLKSF
jgi:hypothetical protein